MSGTGYFAEEGERRERRGRGRVEERGIEEQGIDSAGENGERPADNYLLITHGLLVRALPRVHRTVWRCTVCAVAWAMHGHCMGTACAMHVLAHYTRRWGTAYLYLAHRPSCRCACSACATSAGRSPSSSRHCAALGTAETRLSLQTFAANSRCKLSLLGATDPHPGLAPLQALRLSVCLATQVWNPSNCEIWVLEAVPGSGKYGLKGRWRATPHAGMLILILILMLRTHSAVLAVSAVRLYTCL